MSQRRIFRFLMASICLLLITAMSAFAALPEETKEQRDARMGWWRESRFGMFIHWGIYALHGGIWKGNPVDHAGEWIMFGGKIPVEEYKPFARRFNPVQYDPAEWVRIAKDAGMKYIVITSKHHDGFCLFDSKLTDYDVMSTPYGKDLLKPLAEECRKQGLKICWYHSILDWQHPDYLPRGEGSPRPWDTRSTEGASLDRYIEYMKGQLRELLTNYGDIGIVWFDGGWEHKPEELHSEEVVSMIRELQPKTIINNRINIPQDYDTPEQWIPATGITGRDWEVCMTMNETWGWKSTDTDWKSEEDLIHKLIDIASKGGNFLLNVGPTAEGLIPEPSVERLGAMGRWMKVNSESIYGTSASPFRKLDWGRCTRKGNKIYLHIFEKPGGKLALPGLKTKAKKGYLLTDPKTALDLKRDGDDVFVSLPASLPDPVASVVVVELAGEPEVDNAIRANAEGTLILEAAYADVHGGTAKYEASPKKNCIGFWTDAADWISWDLAVPKSGKYEVEITYGCKDDSAGSEVSLKLGESKAQTKVEDTGGFDVFQAHKAGVLEVPKAGHLSLEVRVEKKPGNTVMDLREVRLTPAN